MAKDFLYKTIEFSKVEKETPYMITRIRPRFSSEVYAEYPDEKFVYTSVEKMEAHLLQLLGYTSAQIALLPLESITSYYEPLYTIKWYIGGLFDFMQTERFISKSSTEINELFVPLIDDSKIDVAQNELLGFTFPERMMQLIRNKPINRMRMFIKDAILTTETVSELVQYDYFYWVTTNQFIPNSAGKTTGIKIKGTYDNSDLNTYLWVVFADTTNDTEVGTQFIPAHNRYIGISCNNISETVKVRKDGGEEWPYKWTLLPTNETDNGNKNSYISLGTYTYYCYIRYSNTKTTLNLNSFDERGNLYQWMGFYIPKNYNNQPSVNDINNTANYEWKKITNFNNIIKYDIDGKRYYLYIRFADAKGNLSDVVLPSVTKDVKISFFNETNNTANNHIYNDITLYEGTIPFNIFTKFSYNHLGESKVAWIKFADTLDASGSEDLYDYAIYKDNNGIFRIRKYMYISINHDENETVSLDNSKYYKVQINDLTTPYSYSTTVVNENNESSSYAIYVKFSDSILPPTILDDTKNYYSFNTTNYILVSITDKNGNLHSNTTNNQNSTFDEYEIILTAKQQEISSVFTKNRYAYFTYVDEITNPKTRSQYPITVVNGENKNKKYFGYSLVNKNPLSNSPRQIQKPDESSKEITLYRASRLNALTEENITKITSINIPYSSMGKFSVFNFDPIILNDDEYLIIGGNRDNTCALTCDDSAVFQWTEDGEHPDYTLKNTDNDPEHGERKIVTGDTSVDDNIMYYTNANFINNTEWIPVYDRYLPIDIGCGYATSSNEVQVTTKSFKDIVEETKINDAAALKAYLEEQQAASGHYKSPNYDLYVNLTYKFAKIIDGNIDYMPLYNRYKIKYKFKNENQVILEKKVFDTSVITPDGSIYNKPDYIVLNGESYGKLTANYIDYFDYIEGEFTDTIKATDVAAEVKDNDYDVAYFQCNNILEQIYQTNYDDVTQGQLYDKNYYNYKWLADGENKDKLPVLCEISISAYDTATPLFTRVVPVTLAAYSLTEVTDDYIKSTVSKIENDYVYGLTQRVSRIELYASGISLSVLNITLGLYSRLQMAEDSILLSVVDASKQIGSAINMYANKILQMVYDVSNNMYSQILVEKQKISLEVSNNFRKAGIYLTDNSATIDAPDIILHGAHTTIKGALSIHQLQSDIDGFVMYDLNNEDKIHITVEDIPKFEDLGGTTKGETLYFTQDSSVELPLSQDGTIEVQAFKIAGVTLLFFALSTRLALSPIKIKGCLIDPFTTKEINLTDIFDLDTMIFNLFYHLKTAPTTTTINAAGNLLEVNTGNKNILNNADEEIIYGEGESTPSISWVYSSRTLNKNVIETIEIIAGEGLPKLHFSNIPSESISESIDIKFDNDVIIKLLTTTPLPDNSRIMINATYNEDNLSSESYLLSKISATMSITIDDTLYTDSASFILGVKKASDFYWEYDGERVDEGECYLDSNKNSTLPHIKILGNDITLSDIQFSGAGHGIMVTNGYITIDSETIDEDNVTITATYNGISKTCTITKSYYYTPIYIPPEKEPDPDFTDVSTHLSMHYGIWYNDMYLRGSSYIIDNIDRPQDIKLVLFNDYNYVWNDGIKVNQNPVYLLGSWKGWKSFYSYYGTGPKYNTDSNDPYILKVASLSWGHQQENPNPWDLYSDNANITATPTANPLKGSYTCRIMAGVKWSYLNRLDIRNINISIDIDTFNNLNAIRFYDDYMPAESDWVDKRIDNYGWWVYRRFLAEDPVILDNGIYKFRDDFNYTMSLPEYYISLNVDNSTHSVILSFILWRTMQLTDSKEPIFDFHLCSNSNVYNELPTCIINDIKLYNLDPLFWRLQNIDHKSKLYMRLSIYTDLQYFITAGTRIGKNGMYSYIDQKSLFYFNSSMIALRQGNNGFRFMQEKNGIPYTGSLGIEIYVGRDMSKWSENKWFSMFNYTPLLRFYMEPNSDHTAAIYKYPEWGYKWDSTANKWVLDNSISKSNGWAAGRIWALGTHDQNQHFYWCYDPSYHKGMLSMEQFCGAGEWAGVVAKYKHFILLPTMYYDDNHSYVDLPPGYTITIINSQFRKTNRQLKFNKGNDEIVEERGELGWPRLPLLVSLYIHKYLLTDGSNLSEYEKDVRNLGFSNYNYTKYMHSYRRSTNGGNSWSDWQDYPTTQVENIAYSYDNKPGNFIDAHGDPCSAIWLTKPNGDYPDDHFMLSTHATFIWNGFIWHASCDGDAGSDDYQIENSNENRD